jgi:hypothetical protein
LDLHIIHKISVNSLKVILSTAVLFCARSLVLLFAAHHLILMSTILSEQNVDEADVHDADEAEKDKKG